MPLSQGIRLEKLALKPGEFLIFHAPATIKSGNVIKMLRYLSCMAPTGTRVMALFGDEKLETLTNEQLRRSGLQRIPHEPLPTDKR